MWRSLLAFLSLCFALVFAGGARAAGPCHTNADGWQAQGLANAASAYGMEWAPFGAAEWGWQA